MWGEGGGREEERRLAKDALKMDGTPAQRQLGGLNIAPLAYASLGKKKEPGRACNSLAASRLGRCGSLQLMYGPRKCVGAQTPHITQQTSTCSGRHHNRPWTLTKETELPPPRPALTSAFTDLNTNHTFTPPARGCTRMSWDRHVHASGLSGMRVY